MPRYVYIAKSQPKETIQGDIEAESEQEAIDKLTRMGCLPISVQPEDLSLHKQGIWGVNKVSHKDIVLVFRHLTSLIGSGVPILNSLSITSTQTANKYLKAILSDIINKIKDGRSLSESMATHPELFSDLYTSMIQTGEVGGNLELTLKRLADFLEKEQDFKNSIRASLTYPAFVFAVGALTVIVLLVFVTPRMITMFEDMGQILPLPTRLLINLSGLVRRFWWLILAIIFTSVFLLRRISHRPQGKIQLDRLKLKTAIWGKIILKTEISRFGRTLSLLLSSGIPVVYALDISTDILENQLLKLEVQKFKERIGNGSSLSQCLKDSELFPAFVANIVSVGEEAGNLEKSLLRIADDYEEEVDRSLKILTQLLEPLIILVMGLSVGFIVLSMLLPIFQINLIVR